MSNTSKSNPPRFTFIDLFSGIGGFHYALERYDGKCLFASDWDKNAAETYEKNHGLKVNGDITKIDEKSIPKHDLLAAGFPCFTGDTLVKTKSGHKEIKNIVPGDLVIGHSGEYEKVEKVFNQGEKNIWIVKAQGTGEIKTTENHKFYVKNRSRVWNSATKSYDVGYSEPEWIEAKDLTKDHYVGFPLNTDASLPSWNGYEMKINQVINKEVNTLKAELVNPDFWYIVGRWLGDGWFKKRSDRGSNKYAGAVICASFEESSMLQERLERIFHITKAPCASTDKFHISNRELASFLLQFGEFAHNKKIPGFVFDLPKPLLQEFINGYSDSDGNDLKNKHGETIGKSFTTVSKDLAFGIAECLRKVYERPVSIKHSKRPTTTLIEGRTVNQRDTYQTHMSFEKNYRNSSFVKNNILWSPIRKSFKTNQIETVYDLQVANAHSFTANGVIVHNCQSFSLAGKRLGFADPTKGTLFFDILRIVKHHKPKVVFLENVKGFSHHDGGQTLKTVRESLENDGYNFYGQLFQAGDWGLPQNRQRYIMVALRKDIDPKNSYVFPVGDKKLVSLEDVLEKPNKETKALIKTRADIFADKDLTRLLTHKINKVHGLWSFGIKKQGYRVYDPKGHAITLTAKGGGLGNCTGIYYINGDVRNLTPRECARVQGFPESFEPHPLRGQAWKQFGNSVPINVLEGVVKSLRDQGFI